MTFEGAIKADTLEQLWVVRSKLRLSDTLMIITEDPLSIITPFSKAGFFLGDYILLFAHF